jgi:two-component system, chemotaxis family, chemotaxis protein CheY
MMNPSRVLIVGNSLFYETKIVQIQKQTGQIIVGHTSNGEECVSIYAGLKPDIIIIDVFLTGMNALETARIIREQNSAINIVICSDILNMSLSRAVIEMELSLLA